MTETESPSFTVEGRDEGDGVRIHVAGPGGKSASYLTDGRESRHYFDFFRQLHEDFGTRLPHFFVDRRNFSETPASWQPLLTELSWLAIRPRHYAQGSWRKHSSTVAWRSSLRPDTSRTCR